MNKNTNTRNIKSSGGQEKEAVNFHHCPWKWETLGQIQNHLQKSYFTAFVDEWEDENQFCFSMQCLLLCTQIGCSEKRAEIRPNRHNSFPILLFCFVMSFFSTCGTVCSCSGANCCCSATVLAKFLTNITTCWACRSSAPSDHWFQQVMKLFPAQERHKVSWLGIFYDFSTKDRSVGWISPVKTGVLRLWKNLVLRDLGLVFGLYFHA